MINFLQMELEILQQHSKKSNSSSVNTSELIKKSTSWQNAEDFMNCIEVLKHIGEATVFH